MHIPSNLTLQHGIDYCVNCQAPGVASRTGDEGKQFVCTSCGTVSNRRISIGSSLAWWVDDTGELWHESAGVFVFNPEGKILFFELTKFPFGLTIPAGHVDEGEASLAAAKRELTEETKLHADTWLPLGEEDMRGDSCSRGADVHRWHAFVCIPDSCNALLDESEGKNPIWLSVEEAAQKTLTSPVRFFIDTYTDALQDAARKAITQSEKKKATQS